MGSTRAHYVHQVGDMKQYIYRDTTFTKVFVFFFKKKWKSLTFEVKIDFLFFWMSIIVIPFSLHVHNKRR